MVITYKDFVCPYCKKDFKRALRFCHASRPPKFCSHKCKNESKITKKSTHCARCSKRIIKNPSTIRNNINVFCDQSCAAIYNNRRFIKKKLGPNPNRALAHREAARTLLKEMGWNKCLNLERCNYDYVIDACHIKPVKDFPKDASVSEVSNPENLIPLCPSCHRKFDKQPDKTFRNEMLKRHKVLLEQQRNKVW